jgi:hypothetical protein
VAVSDGKYHSEHISLLVASSSCSQHVGDNVVFVQLTDENMMPVISSSTALKQVAPPITGNSPRVGQSVLAFEPPTSMHHGAGAVFTNDYAACFDNQLRVFMAELFKLALATAQSRLHVVLEGHPEHHKGVSLVVAKPDASRAEMLQDEVVRVVAWRQMNEFRQCVTNVLAIDASYHKSQAPAPVIIGC